MMESANDRRYDRLIRLPEVLSRTGLSRTTIWRKMGNGQFPRSVQVSANIVAWYESDIAAWIAAPMEWRTAA